MAEFSASKTSFTQNLLSEDGAISLMLTREEHFMCATYRKVKDGCTSDQIRNVIVEEALLTGIRNICSYVAE